MQGSSWNLWWYLKLFSLFTFTHACLSHEIDLCSLFDFVLFPPLLLKCYSSLDPCSELNFLNWLTFFYQSFKMDCCLTNTDAHITGGSENGYVYFWDLVDANVVSSFRAHSSVVKLPFLCVVNLFSLLLCSCTLIVCFKVVRKYYLRVK